jgi:hypothetical protein
VAKGRRSDEELFRTTWVHVFEEDGAEGLVFRPETSDIPLSRRPRLRLCFARDGSARTLLPGPDDRPVETPATWQAEGDALVIRTASEGGRPAKEMRAVRAPKGRLLVKRSDRFDRG